MLLEGLILRAACDRCHKRKQRCMRLSTSNDNTPCRRCKEAGEKCVYSPPCRLGRPSNKSKQQRCRQSNEDPPEEDNVFINSSPVPVASNATSFKRDDMTNKNITDLPQAGNTGSKYRIRQPGRSRRSRNSRSTPPLDSPKSTAHAPKVSDGNLPSKPFFNSSVPSPPNVFRGLLQDSNVSLQETRSIQTQSQHHHIDLSTTTTPADHLFPAPDSHSITAQTNKVDMGNRMWHMPIEGAFRMASSHKLSGPLDYHQQITHNTLSTHSSLQHQSQKFIACNQEGQMLSPITPTSDANKSIWHSTSMNVPHSQHPGGTSLARPLTPPPLLLTSHSYSAGDHTNGYVHPGFVHMPSDNYNPGDPWIADVNEPYYAVNEKSAESPIITTTALIQNYHLQMQLMSSGNLELREGEENWLRYPIYQ